MSYDDDAEDNASLTSESSAATHLTPQSEESLVAMAEKLFRVEDSVDAFHYKLEFDSDDIIILPLDDSSHDTSHQHF